jgi:hypothetical protein
MKVLSLLQPWASLVAIGAKRIETRSWATKYRGPLAIHASKALWKFNGKDEIERLIGLTLWESGLYHQPKDLPYGAVIATCNLVDVRYMLQGKLYRYENGAVIAGGGIPMPSEPELSFGDYTLGRFAWVLEDVRQLPEPIPAKGHQSLWNWVPPEGVQI